jgi:hypothetical protein
MKLILAAVAAFLISFVFSFIAHGMLLHGDYAQLPNLFRPESEGMTYLPIIFLSHVIKGVAFAVVYREGLSEGPHWYTQAIRFGALMVLLITVPLYLVYYAVQPMPASIVGKQIVFDSIGTFLMAFAVAYIMRTPETATAD